MKKLSFVALLLFAALASATSARAGEFPEHFPAFNVFYTCSYPQGSWENEKNPGWMIFTDFREVGQPDQPGYIIYGIEIYQTAQSSDNRRIAFAKPVNGPPNWEGEILRTTWEYTRANGVQCKNTVVRNYGGRIDFSNCTNGKTRVCVR